MTANRNGPYISFKDEGILKSLEKTVMLSAGTAENFGVSVQNSLYSYMDHKFKVDEIKNEDFMKVLEGLKEDNLRMRHINSKVFSDRELYSTIDADVSGMKVNLFYTFNFRQVPDVDEILINLSSLGEKEKKEYLNLLLSTKNQNDYFFSVNDGIMELEIIEDALIRAGAESLILHLPYMPYQRQDRKDAPRSPITAELLFSKLANAAKGKLGRIITYELHAPQNQGHFNGPVDELYTKELFMAYAISKLKGPLFPLATDAGGAKRVEKVAKILDTTYGLIHKSRPVQGAASLTYFIGDPKDKVVLILDDMIASGGTALIAAKTAKENGANEVYIMATHPLFTKDNSGIAAEVNFRSAYAAGYLNGVYTTNTIPLSEDFIARNKEWLHIMDISNLSARVLLHREIGRSVTNIFTKMDDRIQAGTPEDGYILNHVINNTR